MRNLSLTYGQLERSGNLVQEMEIKFSNFGNTEVKIINASEETFEVLMGDVNYIDYGGTFLCPTPIELDIGKCWMVIEFTNMLNCCGRDAYGEKPFIVSISIVCPKAAGKENRKAARQSCSDGEDRPIKLNSPEMIEICHSYGLKATVWQHACGTPSTAEGEAPEDCDWEAEGEEALSYARKVAHGVRGMIGFFMDQQLNRIGNDGWDFVAGDIGFG